MLVILLLLIAVQQFETLRHAFGRLMLVVITMNALNLGWATVLCRAARLRRPESVAIVNEHLIRQEGTAIYVAVSLLGRQDMSLPMIVNSFVGILIGMLFVSVLRRSGTIEGGGDNLNERVGQPAAGPPGIAATLRRTAGSGILADGRRIAARD